MCALRGEPCGRVVCGTILQPVHCLPVATSGRTTSEPNIPNGIGAAPPERVTRFVAPVVGAAQLLPAAAPAGPHAIDTGPPKECISVSTPIRLGGCALDGARAFHGGFRRRPSFDQASEPSRRTAPGPESAEKSVNGPGHGTCPPS